MNDTTASLRDDVRAIAEQQKAHGADRLADLGQAVHEAANGLERELPNAARAVHSAAERLETASSRLRDNSVDDLIATFSDFARRQPAAALAGAALAGFALARFLKSSSAERRA